MTASEGTARPCTCRNFGPHEYREVDPRCPQHATGGTARWQAVEDVRRSLKADERVRGGNEGPLAALSLLEQAVEAAKELRESLRIEPYTGVKHKVLCFRCGGLGEVGPENHDDPKACPCGDCEGLGVRPPIVAAIRKADAALAAVRSGRGGDQ